MKNIFTCDVEDYFQVEGFSRQIKREDWDRYPLRVAENTRKLLGILKEHDTHATFFFLGWVAERFPDLVNEVDREGHEVACHGYLHRLIYEQSPLEFESDVAKAKEIIERIIGKKVLGYRAPTYSITRKTLWALPILARLGFKYDSSIFPIHHDRYGIPDAPRFIHQRETEGGQIWECPLTTVRLGSCNIPIAGGGYFRMMPFSITMFGLNHVEKEGQPIIFYIHPWEVDPDQPKVDASFFAKIRHYYNLDKTESRLNHLLEKFSFGSFREYFEAQKIL